MSKILMFCNYWQVTEMRWAGICMEAQQELLFQLAEVVLYPKYNHSLTASSEKNSTFQEFK